MADPPDTAEPKLIAAGAVKPEHESGKDKSSIAFKVIDLKLCNSNLPTKTPLRANPSLVKYFATDKQYRNCCLSLPLCGQ